MRSEGSEIFDSHVQLFFVFFHFLSLLLLQYPIRSSKQPIAIATASSLIIQLCEKYRTRFAHSFGTAFVSLPLLLPFTFMHLSHLLSLSFLLPALATARPSSLAQSEVPASLQDLELEPSNDFYRYANKVYLLRHGEKGSDGETGLNSKGKKRAKCLKKVSTVLPWRTTYRNSDS